MFAEDRTNSNRISIQRKKPNMSLPQVDVTLAILDLFRERTLVTLAAIEKLPDPAKALAWRPGPGRAILAGK